MPVEQQHEAVIVGTMSGERYLKQRYARPWHELYDGALSALLQPEFRIVSMASRGNDWSAVKRSSQIEAARR